MKRPTENQGNTRTLSEYLSPRSKVKDLPLQQRSLPHFTSFLQETPMKSSQVPSWHPHPPPRRMLPLQSPERYHKDRLGSPQHPARALGPNYSSGFGPSNPTNISYSASRQHPTPRDRLGPLQHSAQPPGCFSSRLVPVNPTNGGPAANRPLPPRIFHPTSSQFMKDLSNHSLSSHISRDQVTESKGTFSYSGNKTGTAQMQEANKAQPSDVRSPIHTVQLHRPPMTPSLNTRAAQDVGPLPLSDSEHWSPGNSQGPPWVYQPFPSTQPSGRSSDSSLPTMHSLVAPCQNDDVSIFNPTHKALIALVVFPTRETAINEHINRPIRDVSRRTTLQLVKPKRTPSSETLIPAVDLNYSCQKRHKEFDDCEDIAKKLCLQGANSGKAQTPIPAVGNSLSTSSSQHFTAMELSPKTINSHLCTEPPCGQSAYLSSTVKPLKPCVNRRLSIGVKQAYINFTQDHTMKLELRSPPKPGEGSLNKRSNENEKRDKSSSLLPSEVPQKDTGSSPHVQLGSHHSGHTHCSTSDKTLSRGNQLEESTLKPVSKSNLGSPGRRTVERNKTAYSRRTVAISDDIDKLFTPDPIYVVSTSQKTAKPRTDGGSFKSPPSEKSCSSSIATSSSTPVTGSPCRKTLNFTVTGSPHVVDTKVSSLPLARLQQISLPTVALERVKLENLRSHCSKDGELRNSPSTSSLGRQLKDESTSRCSPSPLLERRASEAGRMQVNQEDPIDVELDLDLSFALDLDLTQSSHSSEEEQLISLQEMMERVTQPPDTPERGAFSEPSTPGHRNCRPITQPLPYTTKSGVYKNNLDQMLKEINTNKKAKEIETQLLTACKEDLLRIAEYEEAEENREEGISTEQQEFLQRYSLMSNAIREVPPGEEVLNLQKFGQIFNHDSLQLRQCMVNPQGTAQKTLLWSSPAQLKLHVNIGLFQEAYDSRSPCPAQVTRFLFKMMSVHNDRMVSEKILQALCDIACTAAYQIVKQGSQQFKVWVPSLADVALVLMNMGAAFVTLFPFENLQPPFTEGDLLEDIFIKSESPSSDKEQSAFPEHNCNNILKYLSYCMSLCPRAYSDDELLLLLTVVGRLGLDTRLILQSSVELYPLLYKIVNNIRDWDTMMPRLCLAFTDLTDDHHNMCLLVQQLPDNTRGKQLRRHLSLSMISKLLDGNCTYRPKDKEIQLSELRLYLPRMQPSTLLRGLQSSSSRRQEDKEDMSTLDQQSYYICYSLLTLANEASNFQFFPAHQKEQLLSLCSELETHVKCDIRESEKCLYRSKVKDLVARIYTKWQMLLQRTRPLHGKLYDYWQPLLADTLTSSQEEQEMDNSDDGEGSVMDEEEDEEGTSESEESEVVMNAEDKEKEKEKEGSTMDATNKTGDDMEAEEMEGDNTMDYINHTGDDGKLEEMEGDNTMDDTNKTGEDTKPEDDTMDVTKEVTESVHGELNQEMPEVEPEVHKESKVMDEQREAVNIECTEVETENLTRDISHHNQEAACDLVS